MARTVLITGATGKQGGALVRALLSRGSEFRILALTRDKTSPSARRLAAKSNNISLVQGDLNNVDGVFKAAKQLQPDIWGVFSVQVYIFFRLKEA